MEFIKHALDFFLHLDRYLDIWLNNYGTLLYGILFLIIFVETGLVVWPILPGDSLLFAAGALAARPEAAGRFEVAVLIPLLILAALLGDNTNYFIGKFFGHKIKERRRLLFFKAEYVTQTEKFFQKHGGKAIILARFVPIVRTIAPFVAGTGSMPYRKYISFCVIGAFLWVPGLTLLGYFFGNHPLVKKNFEVVILGVVFISIIPIIFGTIKSRFFPSKEA